MQRTRRFSADDEQGAVARTEPGARPGGGSFRTRAAPVRDRPPSGPAPSARSPPLTSPPSGIRSAFAPTSTASPPGRCWRWGPRGTPSPPRRADASREGHPTVEDSPNLAARSPPARSASTTTTGPGVGQVAANRHERVVTPGEPFRDRTHRTVMTTVRPDRTEGGRGSPGRPTRRWPHRGDVLASPGPTRAGHSFRWNWCRLGRPTRPSPRRPGCPCRIRCRQSRPMWHAEGVRRGSARSVDGVADPDVVAVKGRTGRTRLHDHDPLGRAPGPTPGTVRPSGRDRPLRHRRRLLPRWRGRRRSGGIRRVSAEAALFPSITEASATGMYWTAVRNGHVGLAQVGRGDGLALHEGVLDHHGRRTVARRRVEAHERGDAGTDQHQRAQCHQATAVAACLGAPPPRRPCRGASRSGPESARRCDR